MGITIASSTVDSVNKQVLASRDTEKERAIGTIGTIGENKVGEERRTKLE